MCGLAQQRETVASSRTCLGLESGPSHRRTYENERRTSLQRGDRNPSSDHCPSCKPKHFTVVEQKARLLFVEDSTVDGVADVIFPAPG